MWERLRRFSVLDSEARGIFLRAAVLLPTISLSLRIRGFRATQQSLQNFSFSSEKQFHESLKDDQRVGVAVRMVAVRMVNAAARHSWRGATCLEKSLALWWLLRRAGA